MLRTMTAKDYLEWSEQYRIEPFGGMGDSLRNWMYAAVTQPIDVQKEWFNPGDLTPQEIRQEKALEAAQNEFRQIQVQAKKGELGGDCVR